MECSIGRSLIENCWCEWAVYAGSRIKAVNYDQGCELRDSTVEPYVNLDQNLKLEVGRRTFRSIG